MNQDTGEIRPMDEEFRRMLREDRTGTQRWTPLEVEEAEVLQSVPQEKRPSDYAICGKLRRNALIQRVFCLLVVSVGRCSAVVVNEKPIRY